MDRMRKYLEKLALRHTAIGQKYLEACGLNAGLLREIEALKHDNEMLRALALTDELTGLGNRRYFEGELDRLFKVAERGNMRLSLAMLDLDDFKGVNNAYGHLAGDAVLRETAKRINHGIRGTDVAARYGGEEFAVIMPATDRHGAMSRAMRIHEKISEKPYQIGVNGAAYRLYITASIGVATYYPDFGRMSASQLLQHADEQLYRAKGEGKNRVCYYDDFKSVL